MPPDPAAPGWAARRLAWFAVLGGMVSSVLIYRVVIAVIAAGSPAPVGSPLRTAGYVAAAVALLAAIAWARRTLDPGDDARSDPASPPQPPIATFMTSSVISMALAEFSALVGLALVVIRVCTAAEYLAFGAGSFLVLALVILPRGLRYWASWQSYAERRPPDGPGMPVRE